LSIHEEDWLAEFSRAFFECLLEEVTSPIKLLATLYKIDELQRPTTACSRWNIAYVSLHKFRKVNIPDFERDREGK
jgi:hypothetical protein